MRDYSVYRQCYEGQASFYCPTKLARYAVAYADGAQFINYGGWGYPRYRSSGAGRDRDYSTSQVAFVAQSALNAYADVVQVSFTSQSALGAYTPYVAAFTGQSTLNAYRSQTTVFTAQSLLNAYTHSQAKFIAQAALGAYVLSSTSFIGQSTLKAYEAQTGMFDHQSALAVYQGQSARYSSQSALNAYQLQRGTFVVQSGLGAYQPGRVAFTSQSAITLYTAKSVSFVVQSAISTYAGHSAEFSAQSAIAAYSTALTRFTSQSALAAYTAQNGTFTSQSLLDATEQFYGWAINLTTNAVSKYDNYNFNRLHSGLGSNGDGIFELYGSTDNGTAIDGFVETGKMQFKNYQGSPITEQKRLTDLYLGLEGGRTQVTVTTDNGAVTYQTPASAELDTVKVDLARGAKGRYWAVKVANHQGSQVVLSDMKAVVEVLSRKV